MSTILDTINNGLVRDPNAADESPPQKDRCFVVYEGWVEGDECAFARACYAEGMGEYGIAAALRAFRHYNEAR